MPKTLGYRKRGSTESISASLEDYLEAIYEITLRKGTVRARDITRRLGVTYPSVTGALKLLAGKRFINYTPYDLITLTEKGKTVAEDIAGRHEILREFFANILGLPYDEADEAACQIEHYTPKRLVERFTKFIEFVQTCPRAGSKWTRRFASGCGGEGSKENCAACTLSCLDDLKKEDNSAEKR